MKDIDLSELFCEVLSGLVGIFLILAVLDIFGVLALKDVWGWRTNLSTFGGVTTLFLTSYLVGLVIDAFGLASDLLLIDRCQLLTQKRGGSLAKFYTSAPEHVFKYWKEQWTYYSCYRNLLMLMVPGVLVWPNLAFNHSGWATAGVTFVVIVIAMIILWHAMGELLGLYYRIEDYFRQSQSK